jgi:ribokinase
VRCAVVGHVEWVEFVLVDEVPAAGHIAHSRDSWAVPAGGGGVMAVQMARLNGSCDFFTALGRDELGEGAVEELTRRGVTMHVDWHEPPTRRAFTHVDARGERTITTIGPKLLPRGPLDLGGVDTVFFVAGDVEALRSVREARFLGATTREVPTLEAAAVRLDLLVGSGNDPGERYEGGLDAGIVVMTDGGGGGVANGHRYPAAPLPGPVADTYGAGDTFGCTLCFALGRGDDLDDALALAAREAAEVLTLRGPYRPLARLSRPK